MPHVLMFNGSLIGFVSYLQRAKSEPNNVILTTFTKNVCYLLAFPVIKSRILMVLLEKVNFNLLSFIINLPCL